MFHINELILIAGCSGSGKSSIIKKIQRDSCPDLCTQLGVTNPSDWLYAPAKQLAQFHHKNIDRLIVHYDLYLQFSQSNNFNHLYKLINNSNKVTIITLYAPPNILIQRNNLRIFRHLLKYVTYFFLFKGKNRHMGRLCSKREALQGGHSEVLYTEWFRILKQYKVSNHWLLDSGKSDIFNALSYEENLVTAGK